MEIDNDIRGIFDDDQLEESNVEHEQFEFVFPIVCFDFLQSKNFSNGTGFFISTDGYFLTAGHVISNKDKDYKVLYQEKEYDFEILYLENELNAPPICEDLAICKINAADIKLKIEHKLDSRIQIEKKLSFCGYSRRVFLGKIIKKICLRNNESLNFYIESAIDNKRNKPYVEITIVGGEKISDMRYACENVRSLETKKEYYGLSGGPVFDGKNICGLLISKEYILSEYIIIKLRKLNIPIDFFEE